MWFSRWANAPALVGWRYDCEVAGAAPETTEAYEERRGVNPGAPVGMLESGTPGEPEGYDLVMVLKVGGFRGSMNLRGASSMLIGGISRPVVVKETRSLSLTGCESITGLRWGRYVMC